MIESFKSKETRELFETNKTSKRLRSVKKQALRRLDMLHHTTAIEDLRSPPGNQLESLSGKRKGPYSIRINQQYRICFKFENGHSYDVEITDYH
ncbi:Toxin HigB [hydrothermal vent metagenome]|uniref:Toxin HigB n=1 Tax=hydrothermal vent metagenome TaxID=652676 RepID=A0A3B1BRV8_9ZZZZ